MGPKPETLIWWPRFRLRNFMALIRCGCLGHRWSTIGVVEGPGLRSYRCRRRGCPARQVRG